MAFRVDTHLRGLDSSDHRDGKFWVSRLSPYITWYLFLTISPSYEMARRVRLGETIDPSLLPKDFDQVLSVYDDLGTVQFIEFRRWWREMGPEYFGFQGKPPRVTRCGGLSVNPDPKGTKGSLLKKYSETAWIAQGKQDTMFLAVPVGLSDKAILKQVRRHLSKAPPERRVIRKPQAKYPLGGKRFRKVSLLKAYKMALARIQLHDKPLWQAGGRAMISDTYSPKLNMKLCDISDPDRYDRQMLTILASRYLLRARMISENAARGIFPLHTRCEHALEFDYPHMYDLHEARHEWETELERKRAENLDETDNT